MNLDLQKVLPAEAFETEQNEGDYIGKDGLLYCGVCRTKKQTRLPASDFTGGREIREGMRSAKEIMESLEIAKGLCEGKTNESWNAKAVVLEPVPGKSKKRRDTELD